MREAIIEAKKAENIGEVPVGAIIVKNREIIARGHNLMIGTNDPTAHAEIVAIRETGRFLGNYRMVDTEIFVSLEPCLMCYSAIAHARISKIYFGAFDKKSGMCISCLKSLNSLNLNHVPAMVGGILESDCSNIMKNFFKERRN